jgi:acylphosphatase
MVAQKVIYRRSGGDKCFHNRVGGMAREFPVEGYVRTRQDGNVELLAQGELRAVDAYLSRIERALSAFFDGTVVDFVPRQVVSGFIVKR